MSYILTDACIFLYISVMKKASHSFLKSVSMYFHYLNAYSAYLACSDLDKDLVWSANFLLLILRLLIKILVQNARMQN